MIGDDDTTAADPDATTEGGDGTGDTTGGVDVDGDSSDASGEPDPGGESSDDSSGGDGDPEPLPPAPATCGDAAIDPGEQCDDANLDDTDDCLTTCAAASCGDGFVHDGVEACDDTINDGSYGGCMPSCADLAPYCGDDEITSGEHCEPGEQLPFANVDCTHDTCLYDFSAVPQLYCNGTCS